MKGKQDGAVAMPLGLDEAVFQQLDTWRRRLIREADLSDDKPDLLTLLERLSRVRDAIEQVVAALRAPSAAAAESIKGATHVLMDLTAYPDAEADIFGNLHTLGWAIEHQGNADAYLADLEGFEAGLRAPPTRPMN
jgi:hypothetical protein